MNRSVSTWVRGAALPLALLVGLTFAAPPASADEAPPTQTSEAASATPVATAAAAKVAKLDPAEATQAPAAESHTSSSSFFKSPRGVAALLLAAAGVSYVIYSSHHDRLHSPIR